MKRSIHLIPICFVLNTFCFAQESAPITFEKVNLQEELASLHIFCMLQDRKGYIWFGTTEGLNRYDGYSSKVYKFDPEDSTSLSNNLVLDIYEDQQGLFWIGTSGGGICQFNPATEKFINYTRQARNAGLQDQNFMSITEDKEGLLWVSSAEEVSRFDRKTNKFFRFKQNLDSLPDNGSEGTNWEVYKDSEGTIWMAHMKRGLIRADLNSGDIQKPSNVIFKLYKHDPANPKSISSNSITSIYEDHQKVLWVGTMDGGINRFNRETGDFTRFMHLASDPNTLSNNSISSRGLAEDKNGNLWISTENGLNKLNRQRTHFTNYKKNSPSSSSVYSGSVSSYMGALLVDRSGTLWVSSSGLYKINPGQEPVRQFRHEPAKTNTLSANNVQAVCEDQNGTVWIATHGGGLNSYDKITNKFTHYRQSIGDGGLKSDFIRVMVEDRDGNIWLGGGRPEYIGPGFCMLERKTGKFKYFLENVPPSEKYIFSIYEDRQGILWFGTSNGVRSYDRQRNVWHHYPPDNKNPNTIRIGWPRAIGEDAKGNIWIASQGDLNKLDKRTGKFTFYQYDPKKPKSLGASHIECIYTDRKGNLWIGTLGGGLYRYNSTTNDFTSFTEKKGLPNNTVLTIMEDEQGILWLGTNKGLCRFSPEKNTFTNVDLMVPADPFSTVKVNSKACFKGKDGILYFGGNDGLIMFHPEELRTNQFIPPIAITQVKLFDKPLPGFQGAEKIKLNHNANFLAFEFAALNYTNSPKNQYAYQLQGIDPNWVYSGARRFASYPNLPPGEYVFRVKGSNNDGVWNEKGAFLHVIIHPPWWRTWSAYSFYFLCFLAGIFAVDRYQRKRLIQREREKARERELAQAREIERAYHDLKQTQTQLIQREKMASLGELTAGIAHEIQNPLNFVNNFAEVSQELCSELKDELMVGPSAGVNLIVEDIAQNLVKIHYHGQRADSIVKGMLQHTRASTGQKEFIDINTLTDEYLRLSYHGQRAKDRNFNANLITDFDSRIEKVEVVPQEFGRVLLNLFNNAFYATQQKKAQLNGQYQPEVKVSTRQQNRKIEIKVWDNGIGIPENIKNKIFQPFFTTKPTGQGTGLGLSLSYDIINKGHNGQLIVKSKEGEFSEFIIFLPQN